MDETEWLSSRAPNALLAFAAGRVSDRKFRLFSCACVRRAWHLLDDLRFQDAIEVAEQHADGIVDDQTMGAAVTAVNRIRGRRDTHWAVYEAVRFGQGVPAMHAASVSDRIVSAAARSTVPNVPALHVGHHGAETFAVEIPRNIARTAWEAACQFERDTHCEIAREIFGNPFRKVDVDPNWATNDVIAVAREIYTNREFARMPELATLLRHRGCTETALVSHCCQHETAANRNGLLSRAGVAIPQLRELDTHLRGCWALDALLGHA